MKKGYTYIITNHRKTVLYIGVTSDLQNRMSEHKNGEGSFFTKKYQLKYLIYFEAFDDIKLAIAREKSLKGITRKKKEALIESLNSEWGEIVF